MYPRSGGTPKRRRAKRRRVALFKNSSPCIFNLIQPTKIPNNPLDNYFLYGVLYVYKHSEYFILKEENMTNSNQRKSLPHLSLTRRFSICFLVEKLSSYFCLSIKWSFNLETTYIFLLLAETLPRYARRPHRLALGIWIEGCYGQLDHQ